jgi:hypothetical protein
MTDPLEIDNPQVNVLKCLVCGKPMLSQTGLCSACRDKAMDIGRNELLKAVDGQYHHDKLINYVDLFTNKYPLDIMLQTKTRRFIEKYLPGALVIALVIIVWQIIRGLL